MPYTPPPGSGGGGSGEIPTLAQVLAQGNEANDQTIIFEGTYAGMEGYILRLESGPEGIVTRLTLPDDTAYQSTIGPTGLVFKRPGQELGNSFGVPFDVVDGAVWELPKSGGLLASGDRRRYVQVKTTDPIEPGATLDLLVPMGILFRIFMVSTSIAARVRVYVNEDARTADAARPIETPIPAGSGCLLDIQTPQSPYFFGSSTDSAPYYVNPVVEAINHRYDSPEVAVAVTNLGAEAAPLRIGFTIIRNNIPDSWQTEYIGGETDPWGEPV